MRAPRAGLSPSPPPEGAEELGSGPSFLERVLPSRRRAACCAVAALALQGSVAATVCQAGRVELILGGVSPAADCATRAPGRPPAAGLRAGGVASAGERVDPTTQRERDSERRRILEDELAHEQAVLAGLLREGPTADAATVARTRANVTAVRQELARTRP